MVLLMKRRNIQKKNCNPNLIIIQVTEAACITNAINSLLTPPLATSGTSLPYIYKYNVLNDMIDIIIQSRTRSPTKRVQSGGGGGGNIQRTDRLRGLRGGGVTYMVFPPSSQ